MSERSVVRGSAHGRLEAVCWDLDGTLSDTEDFWIAAYVEVAAELGATLGEDDRSRLVGQSVSTAARFLHSLQGGVRDVDGLVHELVCRVEAMERAELRWRPGAIELLGELRDWNIPCALVTGSHARTVEPVREALPPDSFTVVVTGDDDRPGKPDPAPYLEAVRVLGVRPAAALAIEDSDVGAQSAHSAGLPVLLVSQRGQRGAGDTHPTLPSLVGVGASELVELFASLTVRLGS